MLNFWSGLIISNVISDLTFSSQGTDHRRIEKNVSGTCGDG
jgi:hypothetical protein